MPGFFDVASGADLKAACAPFVLCRCCFAARKGGVAEIPEIQLRAAGTERHGRRRWLMPISRKGYPVSASKKSCAHLVTYRQCADQHFEKPPRPLKPKYFMKIFFSSDAECDGPAVA
jgi:hypothetical protein